MELGFTYNQAKIYLTLLKAGRLNAKNISTQSKVPRQEIYRVLDELHEIGIVEKIIALPSEFEAVPLEIVSPILIRRKEDEIAKVKKNMAILNQEIYREKGLIHSPALGILAGNRLLIGKISKMHCDTKKSVDILTVEPRLLQAVYSFMDQYLQNLGRGVTYRVIIDKPRDEKVFSQEMEPLLTKPTFHLKSLNKEPKANFIIFDKKEALIAVNPGSGLTKSSVVSTTNPSLLAICQGYFGDIWSGANCKNFELRKTNKVGVTLQSPS